MGDCYGLSLTVAHDIPTAEKAIEADLQTAAQQWVACAKAKAKTGRKKAAPSAREAVFNMLRPCGR